jgi:hypothetical protein
MNSLIVAIALQAAAPITPSVPPANPVLSGGATAPQPATPGRPDAEKPPAPDNHSAVGGTHQPGAAPGNANSRNPDPR